MDILKCMGFLFNLLSLNIFKRVPALIKRCAIITDYQDQYYVSERSKKLLSLYMNVCSEITDTMTWIFHDFVFIKGFTVYLVVYFIIL